MRKNRLLVCLMVLLIGSMIVYAPIEPGEGRKGPDKPAAGSTTTPTEKYYVLTAQANVQKGTTIGETKYDEDKVFKPGTLFDGKEWEQLQIPFPYANGREASQSLVGWINANPGASYGADGTYSMKVTGDRTGSGDRRQTRTTINTAVLGPDGKYMFKERIETLIEDCGDTCDKPEAERKWKKNEELSDSREQSFDENGKLVSKWRTAPGGGVTTTYKNGVESSWTYSTRQGAELRTTADGKLQKKRYGTDWETIDDDEVEDYIRMRLGQDATDEKVREIFKATVVASINHGCCDMWTSMARLGTGRTIGRLLQAFQQYRGLTQFSSLIWPKLDQQIQEEREELIQDYCALAGIGNCVTMGICGQVSDVQPSTAGVVVGRGIRGAPVTQAFLSVEKSLPIKFSTMSKQELIDLFGNKTVIGGQVVDLVDPSFDPKSLGNITLRLYHYQYFIQNNNPGGAPQRFNIVFKGEAIGRRFKDDFQLEEGEVKEENDYKYKASDYDEVCLTFNPSVTAGGVTTSARRISEYCRPVVQKGGPPSAIAPGDETIDDTLPEEEILW